MKDTELLHYIHQTAQMGVHGLDDVIGRIEDDALLKAARAQAAEYRDICERAAELLHSVGEQPKDISPMASISSDVMSAVQTLADSSASKIAEMIIKGNNMGITKGLKHLHDYEGNDANIRALAEKLIATEQANIEQMKPFL